jgi:hypothetical protein
VSFFYSNECRCRGPFDPQTLCRCCSMNLPHVRRYVAKASLPKRKTRGCCSCLFALKFSFCHHSGLSRTSARYRTLINILWALRYLLVSTYRTFSLGQTCERRGTLYRHDLVGQGTCLALSLPCCRCRVSDDPLQERRLHAIGNSYQSPYRADTQNVSSSIFSHPNSSSKMHCHAPSSNMSSSTPSDCPTPT